MFVQLQLLNFSSRKNALIIIFNIGFWKQIAFSWNFREVEIENSQYFLKQSGKTKINEKLFGNLG